MLFNIITDEWKISINLQRRKKKKVIPQTIPLHRMSLISFPVWYNEICVRINKNHE